MSIIGFLKVQIHVNITVIVSSREKEIWEIEHAVAVKNFFTNEKQMMTSITQ